MTHTIAYPNPRRMAVALLLCVGAAHVHAAAIYACRDAKGATSYQDVACAPAQQAREVQLPPAPPPAKSPAYRLPERPAMSASRMRAYAGGHARAATAPQRRREGTRAFECRAANGEVFYRFSACPKSVPLNAKGDHSQDSRAPKTSAVSGRAVSGSDACRRMQGAARAGSDRDDRVSTYDRHEGRDPCRWL